MNEIISALSAALVHSLWQGGVIALLLAVALRGLPRANPQARYTLAIAALTLICAMPIATFAISLQRANARDGFASDALIANARLSGQFVNEAPLQAGPVSMDAADTVEERDDRRTNSLPAFSRLDSLLPRRAIVVVWLLGVAGMTLMNAVGTWRLRRYRIDSSPIDDPAWQRRFGQLREQLGVRRVVAILRSTRVQVPTVIGALRPVVLIPASALTGMPPQHLEALLLHELAHVRRNDFFVNVMQAVVETLLFYHPAVWWVSRQVRQEREHCCDDIAAALCGRRYDYIRALADMEHLRIRTAKLAISADGGSLVTRIRRLTDTAPQRNLGGTRWSIGAAAGMLAVIAMVMLQIAPSTSAAGSNRKASGRDDVVHGEYRSEIERDHLQLDLRVDRNGRHRNGMWIDLDELVETGDGFKLERDAGTFHFSGRMDRSTSQEFEFRPNLRYVTQMLRIGYEVRDDADDLYQMATLDVSLEFAEGVADLGYDDISVDRLTEFRIHGVSPSFIDGMGDAGYRDLPPQRLVEFRIHGVSPEFVQGLTDAGLEELSESRLVNFRIHGVSPEFVRGLRDAGLRDVPPRQLVEFRIHGVSPEFVQGLDDAGLEDLSPGRLVTFRIHGVSPAYVQELADLGLDRLTPSRLVEFRIHGVSPDFVRRAQDKHGRDLSARELIDMRIHGRL